jgi:hypothetical protein
MSDVPEGCVRMPLSDEDARRLAKKYRPEISVWVEELNRIVERRIDVRAQKRILESKYGIR